MNRAIDKEDGKRSDVENLVKQCNQKTGKPVPINTDDGELEKGSASDPDLTKLRDNVLAVREKLLGH